MKRILAVLLCAIMVYLTVSCTNSTDTNAVVESLEAKIAELENPKEPEQNINTVEAPENKVADPEPEPKTEVIGMTNMSADELKQALQSSSEADVSSVIDSLNSKFDNLKSEIKTYSDYLNKIDKVQAFYSEILYDIASLCIRLMEYGVNYTTNLSALDISFDEKYELMEAVDDCIYEDSLEDVDDYVYDDLFDDIEKYLYDGIIDDAEKEVSYSDWYDTKSNEYDMWYDARSELYDICYSLKDDIYGFYSDVKSELYQEDLERVNKKISKFQEKIEKRKSDLG